ncbi:hypothetical protein CTI12_AA557170 [Artemisia annua]|uniref:Zinc knuckle CX2CX4HX4C n=1 Tax=Artemisia annua TaxID=35608 RepID=A0A2U1KWE5_ARTAN|nr:hypothetical protein CTI12_AA557170 [Artemisia annua]
MNKEKNTVKAGNDNHMVESVITESDETGKEKVDNSREVEDKGENYEAEGVSGNVTEVVNDDADGQCKSPLASTSGTGRLGYAIVLVEVDAKKGLKDAIEVQYCDKNNKTIATKTVKVEYDWKPPMCSKCQVFGHSDDKCGLNNNKQGKDVGENNSDKDVIGTKQMNQNKNEQFVNKKFDGGRKYVAPKYAFVPKQKTNGPPKEAVEKRKNDAGTKPNENNRTATSPKKTWNVQASIMTAIKTTANKYAPLQDEDVAKVTTEISADKRLIVDKYVKEDQDPPLSETVKWTKEIESYYKEQRDVMNKNRNKQYKNIEEIELDENDVFMDKSANARFMTANEINARHGTAHCQKICDDVCHKAIYGTTRISSRKVYVVHSEKTHILKTCLSAQTGKLSEG